MVPFLMLMAMMILWVTTISFSDNFAINHICRRGTLYQLHLWHQEGDVDDEENVPTQIHQKWENKSNHYKTGDGSIDGDVGNNDEEDAGENKTHLPVAENIL